MKVKVTKIVVKRRNHAQRPVEVSTTFTVHLNAIDKKAKVDMVRKHKRNELSLRQPG